MKTLKYISPDLQVSESIALVGSSAILNKNWSEEIDSYDDVVRFNRAPTIGYEHIVGNKTTIYVVNNHVFACLHFGYDRWDPSGQPQHFVSFLRNMKVINMLPHRNHAKLAEKHIHPTSTAYKADNTDVNNFLGKRATVGFAFMYLCVESGLVPDLYGFGIDEKEMTHYWEERDQRTPQHNYNIEREILKEWQRQKKIRIHT